MTAISRPLSGKFVGLSISESETAAANGFPSWQVNRLALQLSAAFLGQGAGILFGHDWRDDGVMEAVHGFALQSQPIEAPRSGPLLKNVLPWPDKPSLSAGELERLASTLEVVRVGLPHDLDSYEGASSHQPLYPYLRARGLTFMRRQLDARTDARVCVGGREVGFSGRYPGVIEEAMIAVEQRTPLYLIGALGGATDTIIGALHGREMPRDFSRNERVAQLYENREFSRSTQFEPDARYEPEYVWNRFRELRIEGIAEANGLSVDENIELFGTPAMPRAIQLVLKGLSAIQPRR